MPMIHHLPTRTAVLLLLALAACSAPPGRAQSTQAADEVASDPTSRLILNCESENPVPEGVLSVAIYDHQGLATDPTPPFSPDYRSLLAISVDGITSSGSTRLLDLDNVRATFANDAFANQDDPTRLLAPSDGTGAVHLFLRNDDACADGRRRVRGGFGNHSDPTDGLQTGSFCCTDVVEIPPFTLPGDVAPGN